MKHVFLKYNADVIIFLGNFKPFLSKKPSTFTKSVNKSQTSSGKHIRRSFTLDSISIMLLNLFIDSNGSTQIKFTLSSVSALHDSVLNKR